MVVCVYYISQINTLQLQGDPSRMISHYNCVLFIPGADNDTVYWLSGSDLLLVFCVSGGERHSGRGGKDRLLQLCRCTLVGCCKSHSYDLINPSMQDFLETLKILYLLFMLPKYHYCVSLIRWSFVIRSLIILYLVILLIHVIKM